MTTLKGVITAISINNRSDVKQYNNIENPIDIANDNCPGQIVLSGAIDTIENIVAEVKNFRIIKLNVSAAFHSKLMEPAKTVMYDALNDIDIKEPSIPIISNFAHMQIKC